jgi:alkyl hydroperoxide reductase subunit D
MKINELADSFKDYARDIKLNLSSVLAEEGAPGLSPAQIWGVALACAYATKEESLWRAIEASGSLGAEHGEAAKAAATIMAMNNVYYRFLHLVEDREFSKMPARLRMNVIGKPGVDKKDFELMCLAVSAMAGCGSCINSHIHEVTRAGVSAEGAQSAVRIASVINAAALATTIG